MREHQLKSVFRHEISVHGASVIARTEKLQAIINRPVEVLVTVLSKARYALAAIRIANGLLALVAPELIIKRFGEDPGQDAAAIYGLRLFGVRTVLIGADLLTEHRQAARAHHQPSRRHSRQRHVDGRDARHVGTVAARDGRAHHRHLGAQYGARHRRVGLQPTGSEAMTATRTPGPAAARTTTSWSARARAAARLPPGWRRAGCTSCCSRRGAEGASGPTATTTPFPPSTASRPRIRR